MYTLCAKLEKKNNNVFEVLIFVSGSLGSQNKTMRREVQECIIRCYVHLTQFTEAIQAMDHLVSLKVFHV